MLIMVLSQADKHVIEAVFKEKGWRGAKIIKEFPSKNWCKSSVNRLFKKVEQTGSIARKKGSGRPTTVCTEENAALVDELLCSQDDQPGTHLSQRKIAQRLNIERKSVRNIKYKLNKKAFKRLRASRKTPAVREKRKTRARKTLDGYSAIDVKRIVFTDEKNFQIEAPCNSKNDVVYGKSKYEISPARLYKQRSRFPKNVMVSAGISWNGKTAIHFIATGSVRVNSERYVNLLREGLLPDIRRLYPRGNFILQQDGARCHTSRQTSAFLEGEGVEFMGKEDWPPESGDLNPMDYGVWSMLSEAVYHDRAEPFTVEELKEKIIECWKAIPLEKIQHIISAWKSRLRDVCRAAGGPIEHLRR